LRRLIESEHVALDRMPVLVGHILAGNTPLLGWTSLSRTLLSCSASIVKLPSNNAADWTYKFVESVADIDFEVASLIALCSWKSGELVLENTICDILNKIIVYGSEDAVSKYRSICRDGKIIAYGHRISLALVMGSAELQSAAKGIAGDVLIYDQGGCLSVQTVYVVGGFARCREFALLLADAMARSKYLPIAANTDPARAQAVRNARRSAMFAERTEILGDPELRWTVIAADNPRLSISSGGCVAYVRPCGVEDLKHILDDYGDILQGACVAATSGADRRVGRTLMTNLGASYLCTPGRLQSPPIEWRQDRYDVLCSLEMPVREP
jgi:hypothetical protein